MKVVSVRVDEETKERMESMPHINWSEIMREAIEKRIRKEEVGNRNVSPQSLKKASEITDELRRRAPGWRSVEEVRKWRQSRS
ncbi:hypothetical protein AKJ39_03945 [candidate division MSBL1 archaeon SCGC-AAA259J03]|uniref:VapB-type antitoxin n=1 Tax=candidate division MSBL1 archaeon SCGC-AAA259J03 TaxID=1698269 RepID=A0A656YV93_9EURY|nr:hypothetical protein AKJ39_03945 [candidate division MSBL1 archaeon SCGC-AAA259J03]